MIPGDPRDHSSDYPGDPRDHSSDDQGDPWDHSSDDPGRATLGITHLMIPGDPRDHSSDDPGDPRDHSSDDPGSGEERPFERYDHRLRSCHRTYSFKKHRTLPRETHHCNDVSDVTNHW